MGSAKDFKKDFVKHIEGRKFSVRKSATSKSYVTDLDAPSCNCEDWQRNLMPCKHLFAVIEKIEGYSWFNLPENYRNSPFISLDGNVIKPIDSVEHSHNTHENTDYTHDQQDVEVLYPSLPRKRYPKRLKASECRDLLNQLKSLSYIVYDMDA